MMSDHEPSRGCQELHHIHIQYADQTLRNTIWINKLLVLILRVQCVAGVAAVFIGIDVHSLPCASGSLSFG